MADIHGNPADVTQMPQAGSGPAPVPYGGPSQYAGQPMYAAEPFADAGGATTWVMAILPPGNAVQESGYAHDTNAGLCTPYYSGNVSPIDAAGDNDAGGRDDMAGTVAQSVSNAEARWHEFTGDLSRPGPVIGTAVQGPTAAGPQQQGAQIGDLMQFPSSALDPGAGVGNTTPTGAFYDPPRGYGATGGASGAPEYVGNEPPPGYQGPAQ